MSKSVFIFFISSFILWVNISIAGDVNFFVSYSSESSVKQIDGRLLLLISDNGDDEPRFQITSRVNSQQVFGIDVENFKPGEKALFDEKVFGFPLESIAEIPPGEYWVQALLHKYETFNRSDGHTIKLPMDRGEGQQWNKAPGNLYSTPQKVAITSKSNKPIEIMLDNEIPLIAPPTDTKYIKHVKIQSKLLTEFWGRPMYLGANILLPEGFEEHPEAKYPLVINHGHFTHTFGGFRETPPDPDLKPEYSERFNVEGYNLIMEEYAYKFYQEWIGPDFPRVIIIEVQHANPYYDDSYAVNSANLGPYGDAITYELIPFIEKKYRGLGEGWARFVYGGSTGGWEALAVQVFYPDEYNSCFAACPDPVDFRAYESVNIYEHKNAYYMEGPFLKVLRPSWRNYKGEIFSTMKDGSHYELALSTNSRSGGQMDIWQAVYGPVGEDGYPKPIWNKYTGEIDPDVAEYWKDNYDLSHIIKRDWDKIGHKLEGKINIYCGDMDNFYLNNAVYLIEEVLENTKNPFYNGVVDYGDRDEHCWNGDHDQPNAISRLRYHQMFVPKIVERINNSAPEGADLTSWKY